MNLRPRYVTNEVATRSHLTKSKIEITQNTWLHFLKLKPCFPVSSSFLLPSTRSVFLLLVNPVAFAAPPPQEGSLLYQFSSRIDSASSRSNIVQIWWVLDSFRYRFGWLIDSDLWEPHSLWRSDMLLLFSSPLMNPSVLFLRITSFVILDCFMWLF